MFSKYLRFRFAFESEWPATKQSLNYHSSDLDEVSQMAFSCSIDFSETDEW